MSGKVTKDVSTRLFKYVTKVDVAFNPFDGRTRSAREFLNRMYSSRFHKANPNLKLNSMILNTADSPKLYVEFVDGSKKELDTKGYHAHELLDEVHMHASSIEYQYQLDGKELA